MKSQLAWGLALYLLLAGGALVLSQGYGGSFVFDDYANLEALDSIRKAPGLEAGIRYSLTGISSPLGRPLALATFALQYPSWPNHPGDFIHVNAMLHLLNACLLFWCLLRLLPLVPALPEPARLPVALAATWFWLFAVPQAGAALYVVQRMAVLSGTLTFIGLLLYLVGREREAGGRTASGFAFMAAGLFVAVPVGLLAKETAALFPVLILVLEYTLLQGLPRSAWWRCLSVLCLWLPACALVLYMASLIPGYSPNSYLRSFTIGERVLTEARVLFLYLQKFLFPPLYGLRIYYDDLEISRSLLSPWTTAAAILAWSALVAAAVFLRRRARAFSFAVLWYLGAHLLESTVIPLEIAFDHRNYVAIAGPALALAWYGFRLLTLPQLARIRPMLAGGFLVYAVFIAVALGQTAALWGKPWELTYYWAQEQPDSRRAQLAVAHFYWRQRQPVNAIESNEAALQRWPGDVSFFLGILETGCVFPKLPKADLSRIPPIVSRFDATPVATVGMLDTLVVLAEEKKCDRHSPAELWAIVEMTFETPRLASRQRDRYLLLSRIADLAGDRPLARRLLHRAIALPGGRSPQLLQRATVMALMAGDLACARHYLEVFREAGRSRPFRLWSFGREMDRLQSIVDEAIAEQGDAPDDPGLAHCDLQAS